MNNRMWTLLLAVLCVLLIRCETTKKDPTAGLPELPETAAKQLRPVPNSALLATSLPLRIPPLPVPAGPPPPPCAADSTRNDYTVQVTYPVVVCRSLIPDSAGANPGESVVSGKATHKLTNFTLPTDVLSPSGSAEVPPAPNLSWSCQLENGPWQGNLSVERGCFGTCSPLNTVSLINVPNLVAWSWYGSLDSHPTDFQFVGTPKLISSVDFGKCH